MKKSDIEKRLKSEIAALAPSDFDSLRVRCSIAEEESEKELIPQLSPLAETASVTGMGSGNNRKPALQRKRLAIACFFIALLFVVALFVIIFGTGKNRIVSPPLQGGYFLIDVNPSVEIDYDENGSVREARGLNEDGEVLLYGLDLSGASYEEAVGSIFERCVKLGYFSAERTDNAVLVSATNTDGSKDEGKTEEIKEILSVNFSESKIRGVVLTGVNNPDFADVAAQYGIDTQKYELIQNYLALGGKLDEEEYVKIPVRELYEKISELEKEAKERKIAAVEEKEREALEELFEAIADSIADTIEELEKSIERLSDYPGGDREYYEKLYEERIEALEEKAERIEDANSEEECRAFVDEILEQIDEMRKAERDLLLKSLLDRAYITIKEIYARFGELSEALEKLNRTAEDINGARYDKFGQSGDGESDFDFDAWQEEYEERYVSSWYEIKAQWDEDRRRDLD